MSYFPFNQEDNGLLSIEDEEIEYKPSLVKKHKRNRKKTKKSGDITKLDYKNLYKNNIDPEIFMDNPVERIKFLRKERKKVLNRMDYIHRIEQSNEILIRGVDSFSCSMCGSWIDEEFGLKKISIRLTEKKEWINSLSPDGKYYILCHFCKNKKSDKKRLNMKLSHQTFLSQYY